MNKDPDDIEVYLDAWGLRRLFSLGLRRRSASRKQRDPLTECFFATLVEFWGHHKKKGGKGRTASDAEQDEAADVKAVLESEAEGEDLDGIELKRAVTDDYMLLSPTPSPSGKLVASTPISAMKGAQNGSEIGDDEDMEEQLLLAKIASLRCLESFAC